MYQIPEGNKLLRMSPAAMWAGPARARNQAIRSVRVMAYLMTVTD